MVSEAQAGAERGVCYHMYSQSIPWVMKKIVPVVEFQGELASDGKKSTDIFWSEDRFWKAWYSNEKIAACVPSDFENAFDVLNTRQTVVLARNRHALIVANFQPADAIR